MTRCYFCNANNRKLEEYKVCQDCTSEQKGLFIRDDEFICKKIDKEFKDFVLDNLEVFLHYDDTGSKFYGKAEKLKLLIESIETLDQKGG